jgi:hypothetical protein
MHWIQKLWLHDSVQGSTMMLKQTEQSFSILFSTILLFQKSHTILSYYNASYAVILVEGSIVSILLIKSKSSMLHYGRRL